MFEFQIIPREIEVSSGHIPNTVTPTWFEHARTPLREKVTQLSGHSVFFGTVRHACYDFQRELFGGSEVIIRTWITRIGTSSATCRQEAWQFNERAVIAETILVAIDNLLRRKAPLSPTARAYLESLLSTSANTRIN